MTDGAVILLVDDDPVFRSLATSVLEREGHTVVPAGDAAGALAAVTSRPPDLIVLDIQLPDMSGLELLTRLRERCAAPVIVVSGCKDESEKVLAFDLGADDYVVKPIMHREFAARVRTALRRAKATPGDAVRFEGIEIRISARVVLVRGERVPLTRREFDLLAYLAVRAGQVVSRRQLLQDLWEVPDDYAGSATLTEHVRRLRRKIEDEPSNPRWIRGVRNVGYSFAPKEDE